MTDIQHWNIFRLSLHWMHKVCFMQISMFSYVFFDKIKYLNKLHTYIFFAASPAGGAEKLSNSKFLIKKTVSVKQLLYMNSFYNSFVYVRSFVHNCIISFVLFTSFLVVVSFLWYMYSVCFILWAYQIKYASYISALLFKNQM